MAKSAVSMAHRFERLETQRSRAYQKLNVQDDRTNFSAGAKIDNSDNPRAPTAEQLVQAGIGPSPCE